MKRILSTLSVILLAACSAVASVPTPMPAERPDDFHVRYNWSVGSLPPVYHYRYTITVDSGMQGKIDFKAGYSPDETVWTEQFSITPSDLDALYANMLNGGVFRTVFAEDDDPPVGGSLYSMNITAYDTSYDIPSFVAGEEQARTARALKEEIEALVPQEIWNKLNAQHDQYVAENEGEDD